MHNIDGLLSNADWLKSPADIKASGGDIEELAKTDPDLPVVQRYKAKLKKNFTSGGGGANTGTPLATGFSPFDLPGSSDSPANMEHSDDCKLPSGHDGPCVAKSMQDFYS